MSSDRRHIRAEIRARRRELEFTEPDHHARQSAELCRRAYASIIVARARRLAAFLSSHGEVDLVPLLARLLAIGKQVYVPQIDGPRLHFAPLFDGVGLRVHRFGIPEPDLPRGRCCPALALDVVLAPLVAFDATGNRIGMGGGYYDRTFAFLQRRRVKRKPLLLGIAFEFQRVARIGTEPWDIPLDGIITERGVQLCKSAGH
ncbi:MAG: 5-formyltetrahydrofolate cyclo-ligase [Gammaproteobacteria bacterium]